MERYFATVRIAEPKCERVAIAEVFGRVLAQSVIATHAYPDAPRSSMDGFAVRADSTPGSFRIVGEIEIGAASRRAIGGSETMRIPTGGIVPEGADAVVPVEAVHLAAQSIRVDGAVPAGDCIVASGADMERGEAVLETGRRVGAPELAVLAALGIVDVPVYRRPEIAVISCGDELIEASRLPQTGQVRDSNPYAIAGSLLALGARPKHYAIVRDREEALEAALASALDECDAVVTSGGSSVGERDFLRRAVDALGSPGTVVHGLRIRPGRPALLGAAGAKPIVGLPGNPASALFVLEAVAAPIVAALTGSPPRVEEVEVRLGSPLHGRTDWTWFVPVALRDGVAHPLPMHSFATSLAARASGYVRLGGDRIDYAAGERVRMRRFLSGGLR